MCFNILCFTHCKPSFLKVASMAPRILADMEFVSTLAASPTGLPLAHSRWSHWLPSSSSYVPGVSLRAFSLALSSLWDILLSNMYLAKPSLSLHSRLPCMARPVLTAYLVLHSTQLYQDHPPLLCFLSYSTQHLLIHSVI